MEQGAASLLGFRGVKKPRDLPGFFSFAGRGYFTSSNSPLGLFLRTLFQLKYLPFMAM